MSIQEMYEEYVHAHILDPVFAEASIVWKDSGERCDGYVFALTPTPKEFPEEDERVFFYVDGVDGLCQLACDDNGEDFAVLADTVNFFDKL